MNDPYFFGYGSLVNRSTHDYPDAYPATLRDWRRAWVSTPGRDIALLTGVPAPGHSIQGLITAVPQGNWQALDERESGYARVSANGSVAHGVSSELDIAVYAVRPENMITRNNPFILLSYLDVVVQGFAQVFGAEGVEGFFATTDNWQVPVLNDRADPIYPRHRQLSAEQTTMVDDHLSRLGARILPRDTPGLVTDF